MTATNTANRFAAAAFSVIISAATFAYAIIPASPNLMV
ncbi:MAG: enoyl-CoA hydratase [Pseudomonadota bacterium]